MYGVYSSSSCVLSKQIISREASNATEMTWWTPFNTAGVLRITQTMWSQGKIVLHYDKCTVTS